MFGDAVILVLYASRFKQKETIKWHIDLWCISY